MQRISSVNCVSENVRRISPVAASSSEPNNTALYINLGALYANKAEDYSHALGYFEKALAITPNHLIARQNIATIYRILGDDSKLSDSLIAFARTLMRRRLYRRAIAVYQDIPHFEHSSSVCYGLGRAYLAMDKYKEAAQWLSKTIELDPNDASAVNTLGGIAYRLGQPKEAVKAYRSAVELDPDNQVMVANLITALLELEQFTEALEVAETYLEKESGQVNTEWIWGRLFVALGQVEKATTCFEQISNDQTLTENVSEQFGVPLATIIVDAAVQQKRFDIAEYVSRKAIGRYGPLHYDLGYSIGRTLTAKGDWKDGLRIMRVFSLAMGMLPPQVQNQNLRRQN